MPTCKILALCPDFMIVILKYVIILLKFPCLKGCKMFSEIVDLYKSKVGTREVGNAKQSRVKILRMVLYAIVEKRSKILQIFLNFFVGSQLKYLELWYVACGCPWQ